MPSTATGQIPARQRRHSRGLRAGLTRPGARPSPPDASRVPLLGGAVVGALGISPDGRLIAAGSPNGTVGIWNLRDQDPDSRRCLGVPEGYTLRWRGCRPHIGGTSHLEAQLITQCRIGNGACDATETGPVVLVATGVNGDDGHREVLGVKVATSETKEAWNVFFAELVARGLSGVRLVSSDAHAGLGRGDRGEPARRQLAALPNSLCRPPGYADVDAGSLAGQRFRAGEVGIVRVLRARRGPCLVGGIGLVGCPVVGSVRWRVL